MNVTIITGWISAVLAVFNFGTCLVMPWATKCLGGCGEGECHKETLGKYHRPIALLTILAIIIHVVASLLF